MPRKISESRREKNRVRANVWYKTHRLEALAKLKAARAVDPDIHRKAALAWYYAHPEVVRARNLKRNYGVTPEWYEKTLLQQNGCCAICGNPPIVGKLLDVDHNHATHQVRGLLCSSCNRGIGFLKESIVNLDAAKSYLNKYAGAPLADVVPETATVTS